MLAMHLLPQNAGLRPFEWEIRPDSGMIYAANAGNCE
jgi:hypothetical protein